MTSQAAAIQTTDRTATQARPVQQSLQEYGRGIAGGLLFSLPLLYTMEIWQAGFVIPPFRILIYVLATFGLLLGYNRYAGLRNDASWREVVIDSIEEMGIGLVLAAVLVWLLGRVDSTMQLDQIASLTVMEAMTVAIGVSIGTAQLGNDEANQNASGQQSTDDQDQGSADDQDQGTLTGQIVLALCGAVLFAANVAPTEEILVIAVESPLWKLVSIALASLLVGAVILYFSDFRGTRQSIHVKRVPSMLSGLIITYAIALLASAAILWFFGRFDGTALIVCVAETVVLAGASMLGAAAGRLLLQ